MAYIPSRKINSDDMNKISRSIGIPVEKILETVKRVERQRCIECGALKCAHIRIEVEE
jgi:hypothetical protein